MRPPLAEYTAEQMVQALSIRLPEERIRPLIAFQNESPCKESQPNDRVIAFQRNVDHTLSVKILSCGDKTTLMNEKIQTGANAEETIRRAAALVSAVFPSLAVRAASAPQTTGDDSTVDSNRAFSTAQKRSVTALLGAAPGMTVAFSGKTVFTGFLDVGVLLRDRFGVIAGADLSTRMEGAQLKKNGQTDETRIGVLDFSFRVGFEFQSVFQTRWFLTVGVGLKYIHSIVEDIASQKFSVEEVHPSARGAVFSTVGVGIGFLRWMSVYLAVIPTITFGERAYKVRGEEGLNLGFGSVGFLLGIRFYL